MSESHETRIKRIRMRSWRRGMKEMDLVLGPWSDSELETLTAAELDLYETLLDENDQELLTWVLGQVAPPEALSDLIAKIAVFARARLTPKA